jgi:hypothetical protein
MTKDRARKQAARERAAVTGERYVVARRTGGELPPHSHGRLHKFMHRMPGVPLHVDGGLQASPPRNHNARAALRHNAHHHEPRVLIAWQNWIARHLGADGH